MVHNLKNKILIILFWVYTTAAIPSKYLLSEDEDQQRDIAAVHSSNKYIRKETDLPDNRDFSLDADDDSTMLLSKLSDQELISLLQSQPKQSSFDVFDIEKVANSLNKKLNFKTKKELKNQPSDQGVAYFKLDNKAVEPLNFNIGAEPSYLANQRIKNLLYSHPSLNLANPNSDESDEKKELMFDILTAQLKKLCCKSKKAIKKSVNIPSYEPLLKAALPTSYNTKYPFEYEQMFLIVNDEVKSDQDSDIVLVDPDSLNENSTVLLLGPITTPLSDRQLKTVMDRITSELSRPEYTSLLQELSQGKVNRADTSLVKSLISGSNTRRFIKPHRCNHRYPLVVRNPKWLICTGYLNINTPSLYD